MKLVKTLTLFFFFTGLSLTAQAQANNKTIETDNTPKIETKTTDTISPNTGKANTDVQKGNINKGEGLTFYFRYRQFSDLNNRKFALC